LARPDWRLALGTILLVALVVRLAYIARLDGFTGGDETVGALMALKIAEGEQFPLVFWEAHYTGTLPFVLGAAGFRLFEPSLAVLRLAILPFALVGIAAITATTRAFWGTQAAILGGLSLALGPPLLFAHSTVPVGGYPEVLAFGGLTLWLGAKLALRPRDDLVRGSRWALLGVVAGFGVYSLPFVLPLFAGVLWTLRRERGEPSGRRLVPVAGGFIVGVSPFILYNIVHPGASVTRLAGRIFDVSRHEVAHAPSLLSLLAGKGVDYVGRLVQFPVTLTGNVPVALALPLWGLWVAAAAVAAGAAVAARRRGGADVGVGLLGRCGLLVLLFIWTAQLTAPRHLFPFFVLAPLGIGALWVRTSGWGRVAVAAGLALLLANNVVATLRDPPVGRLAVGRLVDALEARGVRFVYTDYQIAYPLVFLSRERIIASPQAGPTNVDRYSSYTRAVAASQQPAYVFRQETEASAVFVREMRRTGRGFSREGIDGFDLYLPERHVDPDELGLLRKF